MPREFVLMSSIYSNNLIVLNAFETFSFKFGMKMNRGEGPERCLKRFERVMKIIETMYLRGFWQIALDGFDRGWLSPPVWAGRLTWRRFVQIWTDITKHGCGIY